MLSWCGPVSRRRFCPAGVWARWRSYSRRFSCLASSSAGVGSTRGFGVLGWGVAFRDVFTAGLFQLWGRPPLLAGFGREKVNSKVWPIAHSCGGTDNAAVDDVQINGLSPRGRGNPVKNFLDVGEERSIPALAGIITKLFVNLVNLLLEWATSNGVASPQCKTTPLLTPAPCGLDPTRRTLTQSRPTTFAVG